LPSLGCVPSPFACRGWRPIGASPATIFQRFPSGGETTIPDLPADRVDPATVDTNVRDAASAAMTDATTANADISAAVANIDNFVLGFASMRPRISSFPKYSISARFG
jgi:hypothetical protein